jgi:phospholipid transport system substrate-binding protein
MKRLLVGFILLVLLIIPLHVSADVPFDTVKGHVNAVLKVLRDPALQGEANEEAKQEKIEAIADEMFDYVALSRLTLGRNWKKFNSDQKKEFVQLYRSILEKAYMDRILSYTDEKVFW